jgi:hypothetical protein
MVLCAIATTSCRKRSEGGLVLEGDRAEIKGGVENARPPDNPGALAYLVWDADGDGGEVKLSCLVRNVDSKSDLSLGREQFTIVDKSGTELYKLRFEHFHRMYQVGALRDGSSQLVIEYDQGGSSSIFFNIFDYREGKVRDLMADTVPNNDFSFSAEVRPQSRTGINPAKEPFEILLTSGTSGLASAGPIDTEVFRYDGRVYRLWGSFSQSRLEHYAEGLMKH